MDGFACGEMDQGFVEKVRGMDGIKKVLPIYVVENSVKANGNILARLESTGNLDWYSSMFALNYSADNMPEQALSAFEHERSILLSTSGSVYINGTDISCFQDEKMSRIRRNQIGFVFQFYNLIPNLNVEENIMLPLLLDGKKIRDYEKQLDQILQTVGLIDRRKHTPRQLSGGQQQRVAIARALITNPQILFADEPTGNLDSKTGLEIMNLLKRINREYGQTIIMVTHSPEAAKSSSRIIVLRDGLIEV